MKQRGAKALQAKIAQNNYINNEAIALRQKITELQNMLAQKEQTIASQNSTIYQKNNELNQKNSEISTLRSQVNSSSNIQGQIQTKNNEIVQLKSSINNKESRITQLESLLIQKDQMIDILQKTNEGLRADKEELQAKIIDLDEVSFAFESIANNQPANIETMDVAIQTDDIEVLGEDNFGFNEIGDVENG